MRRLSPMLALSVGMVLLVGCSWTQTAKDFSGVKPYGGTQAVHVNTTTVAIDVLMQPILGDASLEGTIKEMTTQAKAQGATEFRIVQSASTRWWFIYPPFSFIIHPVVGHAAGDAIIRK